MSTAVKKRRVSGRNASQGSTTTTSSASSSSSSSLSCFFDGVEPHNAPLEDRTTSSSTAIQQRSRRETPAAQLRRLRKSAWAGMFEQRVVSHNESLESVIQSLQWQPINMTENTESNFEKGLTEAEKGMNRNPNPPHVGYFTSVNNHDDILDTFTCITGPTGPGINAPPTSVRSMIRGSANDWAKISVRGTTLRGCIRAIQFLGSLADFKRLQAMVIEGGPAMLKALVTQADAAYETNRGRTCGGQISSYFVSEAAEDGSKVSNSLMIKTECVSAKSTSNKIALTASLANGGVGGTANGIKLKEALFNKTNADGRKYLVWRKVFYIEQHPAGDYDGDDVLDTERLKRICAAEMKKAELAGASRQVVNSWKLE